MINRADVLGYLCAAASSSDSIDRLADRDPTPSEWLRRVAASCCTIPSPSYRSIVSYTLDHADACLLHGITWDDMRRALSPAAVFSTIAGEA